VVKWDKSAGGGGLGSRAFGARAQPMCSRHKRTLVAACAGFRCGGDDRVVEERYLEQNGGMTAL
jgi:hypothetical protein